MSVITGETAMLRRIATVTFSLILPAIPTPTQPLVLGKQYAVAQQSSVEHHASSGCQGEYETIDLPAGGIDAYPGWPPRVQPGHILIHYDNRAVLWGKPSYGSPECGHFNTCRRATFILNPTYTQCIAHGHVYEVTTLDGKPVLHSRLLQVIDPAGRRTVDVAFACGRGFAGPDFASIGARISQAGCTSASIKHGMPLSAIPAASISQGGPYSQGMTLAAGAVLSGAYFRYRATVAQPTRATCTTNQLNMTAWTTTCR